MELSTCITRILHRDNTLTEIIIKPSCLAACNIYEPHELDENFMNADIYNLHGEFSGSREWFELLGVIIAQLSNLTQLTFDGIDPDTPELERFWGQISVSSSLKFLNFANMNLESCEEILGGTVDAPSLKSSSFRIAPYLIT